MNLRDGHHESDPPGPTGGLATRPSPVDRRLHLREDARPPAIARSRDRPADAIPGRQASRFARCRRRSHATGRRSSATYLPSRRSGGETAARAEARAGRTPPGDEDRNLDVAQPLGVIEPLPRVEQLTLRPRDHVLLQEAERRVAFSKNEPICTAFAAGETRDNPTAASDLRPSLFIATTPAAPVRVPVLMSASAGRRASCGEDRRTLLTNRVAPSAPQVWCSPRDD